MILHNDIPFFQTNAKEIQPEDVEKLISRHKEFQGKFIRNENYYSDKHKILLRKQSDENKPNYKIVESLPSYAVDIRTGYFSGEPITFTCKDETQQELLDNILEYNDFQECNMELDHFTSIDGQAFLILYTDEEANIRFTTESAKNCFAIHDTSLSKNMVGAIRYYEYEDVEEDTINLDVRLWTKDKIYHYIGPSGILELVEEQEHNFGDIPVIEFMENTERKGCFENQISLVDAIESIISSCINEIEYSDNAYLMLKNLSATEDEDVKDMKNNRIMLIDEDGDAKFITKDINDTYIQNTLTRLVADFHKLTKTPPLTDESFAGNASGVALKFKLFGLEKDMSKKERKWKKSIQRMLELVTNVINAKNNKSFDYREIKLTFTRALPTNITEMADMVAKLNGILSDETLISQLSFVENAKEEIERKQKEDEEKMQAMDIYRDSNIGDPKLEKDDEGENEDVNNDNSMDSSNS